MWEGITPPTTKGPTKSCLFGGPRAAPAALAGGRLLSGGRREGWALEESPESAEGGGADPNWGPGEGREC